MSPICSMNIVFSIASNTSIIVAFGAPKSIRACCVVHYQLAVCISLYICLSSLSTMGLSELSVE